MPSNYANLGDKQTGDVNILKLKDVNRIRPLDNVVAGWRQHGIEHPSDPEQFSSVVCPGPRTCPLDRKPVDAKGDQRFPISRRFAANVWDYDTSAVKVLVAGPSVFDKLKEAAKVGIDPSSCDWMITKSGQGLNTRYEVVRYDASPFTAAQIGPEQLHDVAKYEQPTSPEAIFELLEKFGIDYDALEIPSYSYDNALAFRIPFGKHRGETVEQILAADVEYAGWLHGSRLEAGQLGDPIFLALQVAMEEREMVPPLEEALSLMPVDEPPPPSAPDPAPAPAPPVAPSVAQDQTSTSPASAGMKQLVGPDGNEVVVPASVVEVMLKQGFKPVEPPPAATSVDANAPIRVLIGGQEVSLPREQALALIAAGTAQEVPEAPAEPEAPKLPLPDEEVQVNIGGVTVPMPYVQAAGVVDNPASGASFADPGVAEAHARSNAQIEASRAQAAADPTPSPATDSSPASESALGVSTPGPAPIPPVSTTGSASATAAPDPERPFACPLCDKRFKTQGALTQHSNREHKGAGAPQPTAIPSAGNGNASLDDRLKDKIQHAPFAKDYQTLLRIFQETTGKKNFTEMTEEEKQKLEQVLDQEIAKAQAPA